MKIKVCIRTINTDGTKYENKAFDCPSELIEQCGESKLTISELCCGNRARVHQAAETRGH